MVGHQTGSYGRYDWTGGLLDFDGLVVGAGGTGVFVMDKAPDGYYPALELNGSRRLVVGRDAGSHGTFEQHQGDVDNWSDSGLQVGVAGQGVYRHSYGAHWITETLTLGVQTGGRGEYILSGSDTGWSDLHTGETVVGGAGQGMFSQSGGHHSTDRLLVGSEAGSNGAYHHQNGDVLAWELMVGHQAGSYGRYEWNSGWLDFDELVIGAAGTGVFVMDQSSDSYDLVLQLTGSRRLVLGRDAGSHGTFEQRRGDVDNWSDSGLQVGVAGQGVYRHSQGEHQISETLTLGVMAGSRGEYILSGSFSVWSVLHTQNTVVGGAGQGRFTQSGGQHATNQLTIAASDGGRGEYRLTGGSLDTLTTRIGVHQDTVGLMDISGRDAAFVGGDVQVGGDILDEAHPEQAGRGELIVRNNAYLYANQVDIRTGGTFRAEGLIEADIFNHGNMYVGASTDTGAMLDVYGNLHQDTGGRLHLELGTGQGDFDDLLNVYGSAGLGGDLVITLGEAFSADEGMTFDILYASAVIGEFDSLFFPVFDGKTFDIFYGDGWVDLTVVSAVPVPAAVWLFGSGLLGLFMAGRRRPAVH
ncbi:VPLPA-CTERM sorting domain-containing protein [Thiohalobacter thiocyanaticus]|uniref:VPLPA-CTERM sorting domain-containing protein n=1 Tax=Thiohalobacter thiocyanaticus TaxID=585455 RepID=UPI0019D47278|nr:VPLPA-CTERM sorting domain-containing protein [Thiohalobacter thiocyanaticus]